MMWNLLNGLSIMMSHSLLSLPVPGVASMIQSVIMEMILLDIMQSDDWLTPFFQRFDVDRDGNSLPDQGLNQYFENSGFSSMHMLINLGSTFVHISFFLGLLIMHLLFKGLTIPFPRQSQKELRIQVFKDQRLAGAETLLELSSALPYPTVLCNLAPCSHQPLRCKLYLCLKTIRLNSTLGSTQLTSALRYYHWLF